MQKKITKVSLGILALSIIMMSALFVGCADDSAAEAAAAIQEKKAEASEPAKKKSVPENLTKALPGAKYVMRMAYTDAGTWPAMGEKPQAEHAYALLFKSVIESMSNGELSVELYPGGTLAQSKAATEMVQNGTLEMAITTGTIAPFYPQMQVFSLPYAFRSDEVAWRIFDESDFWKDMVADMAEEANLLVLGMGQNGTRHFTNSKRPIHSPDDMDGMKFRVMSSPIFSQMVTALGATAMPLAHNEIYTACQTGVVDGQENPVWNIAANNWYEVQDYMTLDGHVWSENMLLINNDYFNDLPGNLQQIIRIAALQGQWADRVSEALASKITDFSVLKNNMEIYAPTAEEMDKFKAAVEPVKEWLKGEVGAKVVDDFYAAVAQAEAELGY
ncbi:DctP family TRAP transporter solute-binding subunit [Marispirochaeta sp.]|uniref:DctP family TRAP transporter solute-binding subunit n=1 Tax=Marispirochaeta sp. TaxID=2038653 RepID=UPI0029C715CC|nr:DctP family TRAP transporter solute-binding subunit [Marispirochaeta sp.]